jgi:hypothetical protein
VLQLDWVQFLQRAYSKSGVKIQPDLPVFAEAKSLSGIIQYIDSADPRVLGQYRIESSVCLVMSSVTKIGSHTIQTLLVLLFMFKKVSMFYLEADE